MKNNPQKFRFFKDSESDTTWADQGILYVRFDTETNVIYFVGKNGAILSECYNEGHPLDSWLREQIAIEIPEAEAALL